MRVAGVATLFFATLVNAAVPDPEGHTEHGSWAVVSGYASEIRFEPLARGDGFPTERVYQVLQDRRGFRWFTTLDGLIRHDGYQHVRYSDMPLVASRYTANRLPGTLFEDSSGTLWVATDVLNRFDPNLGKFTAVLKVRPGPARPGIDAITAIHEGQGGDFWVGMSSYGQLDEVSEPVLYQVNPASGLSVPHRMDTAITNGRPVGIRAIKEDRRGRLWLATSIGLVRFDPVAKDFRHYLHTHPSPHFMSKTLSGLVWDKTGHLWVRMPIGIERFNPETEVFDRLIVTGLWNMTPDPSGRIWLWGGKPGLEVFDPSSPPETALKRVLYKDPSTPFEEVTIPMLGSDRQGNIWTFIYPSFSLYRYSPRAAAFGKQVATLNSPNTLRGGMVTGFSESRSGSIWIATNRGLSLFDPQTGGFTHFEHDSRNRGGIPSRNITSVYLDRSNRLWVATDIELLGLLDWRTGQYRKLRPSQWSRWAIQSMYEDRHGRFWVGDQMGSVRLLDRQTGAVSQEIIGHVTYEDREGNLWFGAPPGLNKLDRTGNLRSIPMLEPDSANAFSPPIVRTIHEDSGGILWLASNAGLFRFDPRTERAVRFTPKDGLASANLSCVLSDDNGYLWISTDRGISRFDPREKRFYNYEQGDGLQGNRFTPRACCKASDGRLYFGGNLGFNGFNPRDVLAIPDDISVVLTSLRIDEQIVPGGTAGAMRLKHDQNRLTFEFAAPYAASPWKLRYRFRLEGMESSWIEVDSAHRLARYTDIPPNSYIFRVESSTDGRSWAPGGAAVPITILPPWWGTWWARVLAALLIFVVLGAAYWLRVEALHRRERQLTALVDRRTAELERARDQAEAANRAKSQFLATMSHELRTPLNVILGFANLLRQKGVSGEQGEHVNIINRSGEYLLTLIDDILDLAKIESGRQSLNITPCDLTSLVEEIIEMIRVRARSKNLELAWERSPSDPRFVRIDESKLRQILVNLLSNAVKFTAAGSVTLRSVASARKESGVLLQFEVEDTGVGIAEEDKMRIFQPFVQASLGGVQKGTGLGLSITKHFVEMMGGTITVESVPGQGSLFRVELPAEVAEESDTPVRDGGYGQCPVLEEGQPVRRVLVVDDNADNTMVMAEMLRQAGFQARMAHDGAMGVEQFQQWRPHFIWMDVRMPVMDGIEATKRIRELDGGREVKIAAVTASAFREERDTVLAAGMDDFIRKPYRWSEVFECMSRHLGVRYVQKAVAATETVEKAGLLRGAALGALPGELRTELMDAVLSLDARRVDPVIDRIRELDESLASSLRWFADRLNYTAILTAIEGSEQASNEKHRAGKIRYDTSESNP